MILRQRMIRSSLTDYFVSEAAPMHSPKQLVMLGLLMVCKPLFALSLPAVTFDTGQENRWSLSANVGVCQYQHVYGHDATTSLGRLALAAELLSFRQTAFGLEMGVQTGNRMHVIPPVEHFGLYNELITTTIRPMIDFLVTTNTIPLGESLLFTQLKGGLAYRQWKIAHDLLNNISEFAGEVQAGFGYPLTEAANLTLLYQGVFSGNTRYTFGSYQPNLQVSNIPVQHGMLFGISLTV